MKNLKSKFTKIFFLRRILFFLLILIFNVKLEEAVSKKDSGVNPKLKNVAALLNQLDELIKENNDLKEQVDSLNEKLQKNSNLSSQERQDLENQIQKQVEKLNKISIQNPTNEITQALEKISEFKNLLDQNQRQKIEVEEKVERLSLELEAKQGALNLAHEKLGLLSQNSSEKEKKLAAELTKLSDQIKESEGQLNSQVQSLGIANKSLEKLQENYNEKMNAFLSLKEQIKTLREDLSKARNEKARLENEVVSEKQNNLKNAQGVEAQVEEIEKLNKKISEIENQLKKMIGEKKNLESLMQKIIFENESKSREILLLSESKEWLEFQLDAKSKEYKLLLQAATEKSGSVQQELTSQVDKLTEEKQEAENKLSEMEVFKKELEGENQRLRINIALATQKISELLGSFNSVNKNLSELENNINNFPNLIQQISQFIKHQKKENLSLQGQVKNLQNQVENLKNAQGGAVKNLVDNHEIQTNQLKKQIIELINQNEKLKKQLNEKDQLDLQQEEKFKSLEQYLNNQGQQIAIQNQQIIAKDNVNEQLKIQNEELSSQIKNLEDSLKQIESEKANLEKQLFKLEIRNESLSLMSGGASQNQVVEKLIKELEALKNKQATADLVKTELRLSEEKLKREVLEKEVLRNQMEGIKISNSNSLKNIGGDTSVISIQGGQGFMPVQTGQPGQGRADARPYAFENPTTSTYLGQDNNFYSQQHQQVPPPYNNQPGNVMPNQDPYYTYGYYGSGSTNYSGPPVQIPSNNFGSNYVQPQELARVNGSSDSRVSVNQRPFTARRGSSGGQGGFPSPATNQYLSSFDNYSFSDSTVIPLAPPSPTSSSFNSGQNVAGNLQEILNWSGVVKSLESLLKIFEEQNKKITQLAQLKGILWP